MSRPGNDGPCLAFIRPKLRPNADPEYPYHDHTVRVTRCGRICFGRLKVNLSTVFAGQLVGIREVEEQIRLVSFLDYDLGFFDTEKGRGSRASP